METYYHENGDDVVEIDGTTYRTYTSGTRDPLYIGEDAIAARESLDWDEFTWNRILMGDPVVCD